MNEKGVVREGVEKGRAGKWAVNISETNLKGKGRMATTVVKLYPLTNSIWSST